MKSKYHLIREFTEFNLQRMNPDSARASIHVDDPSLSINAFDKHEDTIRQAIAQIGQINKSLQHTSQYRSLKSKLGLESQNIQNLTIIKIVKSNPIDYDVYFKFTIDEQEYWGVINNILNTPEVRSEVFKDDALLQTKEWLIRTKGLLLKQIRLWMKPQFGFFKSLKDEIHCYSGITGKLVILPLGAKIEVLKSYDDKIIFSYDSKQYTLTGDNFVYFNWWFEKVV
jgi:hypothetical protein